MAIAPRQTYEKRRRRRGAAWLLWGLLGLLLLGLLLLLLFRNRGGEGETGATGRNQGEKGVTAGAPGEGAGTLTAEGQPILPAPGGSLGQYGGKAVQANAVTVQSVVADEGMWLGSSEQDRVSLT